VTNGYSLPLAEVHLWRYALSQGNRLLSAVNLSPDELLNLSGFRRESDRLMRIAAWQMMRFVLSRYLRLHPEFVGFGRSADGRPYLSPKAEIDFNLSHTADAVLLAVSRRRRVGVDIETCANAFRFDCDLIEAAFSVEEQRALEGISNAERPFWALQWWTRKEAVLKTIGIGLGFPARRVEVVGFGPGPRSCPVEIGPRGTKVIVLDLELSSDWRASLAFKGDIVPIRYFCLGWPRQPHNLERFIGAGSLGINKPNTSTQWISVS
jgi:4'-phosphopantetheinyl transferase